ncbi:hypothetical protein BVER_05152c [Candidatus Burkholderia verschuerenii]|uniref:Uncharacterized protein n=1 Tax=Candidatus Burkholderia verschuerenii TaxID=242163 RepID=A0A0L0M7E0_9BURK|nr:hypothetical protein [Candidatus Burkholderia verschuerenii]KND57904.1 hypothetical protein BVER_05152c [Candidatus Burkholderia verschuerenii]
MWRLVSKGADLKIDANAVLREVSGGLQNLEPEVAKVLKGVKVAGKVAHDFASDGFRSLKSLSINGVDGGLSLISLYFLQDSLKSSMADLDAKVGARHPEVVAAFYGASVSMMGGATEMAGQALKIPAKAAQVFIQRAGTELTPKLSQVIGLGEGLVKAGGVIAAVGGIADAAVNLAAATRVSKVGDANAAKAYYVAGGLSLFGAISSTASALGAGLLMGPLGIGIALGSVHI